MVAVFLYAPSPAVTCSPQLVNYIKYAWLLHSISQAVVVIHGYNNHADWICVCYNLISYCSYSMKIYMEFTFMVSDLVAES